MAKKPDHSFIIGSTRGIAEARRNFERDDAIRSDSGTLLKPDDIAGEYDFSRRLMTMLGGVPRTLTIDDLKQFSYIAKNAIGKFKKGISAKQIIDLSMSIDRERANKEIKTATPISLKGGQIRFMTNTGPNSDRQRHYVTVNLVNFEPIVASDIKVDKAGRELSKSPLQISCSCGRWRFWLAYLATRGNYNSGHREDAFPKIRNPGLSGVACKHILRVMTLIHQSPFMKTYMANMVTKARLVVDQKRVDEKVADTRAAAEQLRKESSRQKRVITSDEKKAIRQAAQSRKSAKEAIDEVEKIKPKRKAGTTKKLTNISTDAMIEELMSRGLTRELAEQVAKQVK